MAEKGLWARVFSRLTFRSQLSFFLLVTAMLAIVFISVIAYTQAIQELKNNFNVYTASILHRTRDELLTKLNAIENTLTFISTDQRLQNINDQGYSFSPRNLTKFFMACITLNNYQESSEDRRFVKNLIDELIFYSEKDRFHPVIISRRDHFSVYGIERYLTDDLLNRVRAAQGMTVWTDIFYNELGARLMSGLPEETLREELNQFAVIKCVTDEKFKTEIGFLVASINLARLSDLVEEIQLGLTGRVYIVDKNLRVLGAKDKDLILQEIPLSENCLAALVKRKIGSIEGQFAGENSFIHFEEIGLANWKLVGVIASREFQSSAAVVRNRILIGGVAILFVFTAVAVIISGNITRPIKNICNFLQKVEGGDLSLRTNETGSIEIKELSRQLNRMIDRITNLLNEVYREQRFKRKMALKALHAQINPHFIYNTLDSISWLVETDRREVAAELLESLSTIFRIGLSGGRDIVTIGEELEHAESYLRVQKIRYQNKLDYVFDIDEEIKKNHIVKITLQPLIENAIYHGIKPKTDGPGTIFVSGEIIDEETVRLSVVDNGVGMSEDKVKELRTALSEARLDLETQGKGYSLLNINTRIKLYFGQNYGLNYTSQKGIGTRVDIILPVRNHEIRP